MHFIGGLPLAIVLVSMPSLIIALGYQDSLLGLAFCFTFSEPLRPAVLGGGVDDVLVIPFGNHILLVYKFRVPVNFAISQALKSLSKTSVLHSACG